MEGILREGLKASAAPTRARIAAAVLNIAENPGNPTSASPCAERSRRSKVMWTPSLVSPSVLTEEPDKERETGS